MTKDAMAETSATEADTARGIDHAQIDQLNDLKLSEWVGSVVIQFCCLNGSARMAQRLCRGTLHWGCRLAERVMRRSGFATTAGSVETATACASTALEVAKLRAGVCTGGCAPFHPIWITCHSFSRERLQLVGFVLNHEDLIVGVKIDWWCMRWEALIMTLLWGRLLPIRSLQIDS
jgi:hypothetical protein